jgi:hypothetical protein
MIESGRSALVIVQPFSPWRRMAAIRAATSSQLIWSSRRRPSRGIGSAYGRYRRKVADLMVAFGTTIGLRFVSADPEERSYIERV